MKGASLEWFTIQNWMAVYDDTLAVGIVPVEAPLATFGEINRGNWPARFEPHSGTMFSYLMNNYWDTNYRAGQSGDFAFRYVLTSDSRISGAILTHLGTEERRPVELNHVTTQDKPSDPQRPLPAEGTQFLETHGDGISLVTWKKAEDGRGTILRLLETTSKPTDAVLRFPHAKVSSAELCSGVEDACRPLPAEKDAVRISLKGFEVKTVRIIFSP
jgi:alpha-mannosidase